MFFKSLPSEKIQKGHLCGECGKEAPRVYGPFFVHGTQNSGMEEAAAFSMKKADIGGRARPVYRDENGQIHEVKTSGDIRHWQESNTLGKPVFVEWANPVTGKKSWVPKRTRMVADPLSGEPMDGPVVHESAKIIPLDEGDFSFPTETRTGIPMDPSTGTPKVRDYRKMGVSHRGQPLIDPETMKPMSLADMWGGPDIPDARPGQLDAVKREILRRD